MKEELHNLSDRDILVKLYECVKGEGGVMDKQMDHEKRLRSLERSFFYLAGGISVAFYLAYEKVKVLLGLSGGKS